eukprot:scaffold362_cov246-Pinguiococcus_pyrenoidosus.AAC.12
MPPRSLGGTVASWTFPGSFCRALRTPPVRATSWPSKTILISLAMNDACCSSSTSRTTRTRRDDDPGMLLVAAVFLKTADATVVISLVDR